MWLTRIISSLFGIRKKNQLSDDLKNISLFKVVILFMVLNIVFISIVIAITNLFIN